MRTWVMATAAGLLSAAFVGMLELPLIGGRALIVLSDAGQLLAAGLAAAGCGVAASRSTGQRRRAWAWLSAGTGAWALGQLVWTYYEVVLHREAPFPSEADVGFLLFPLAATAGLVVWLGTQSHELAARGRDVLDGGIIAASLLVLSWLTTLDSVLASDNGRTSELLLLSLAYPIGDLLLGTLVLLALARGTAAERTTLALLALGLGWLALADSAYVYLSSLERYESADFISSGWVAGFLFVTVAAMTVRRGPASAPLPAGEGAASTQAAEKPTLMLMCLPYVPLLAAGVALCWKLLDSTRPPTTEVWLGVSLVTLVLTRQFLAILDNQRLLSQLSVARDRLEHQALHDPLTGLPNRVLFADRLDQALLRPGADVSVLFCDLDDFKLVNDGLGHDAGDRLLSVVAGRLLACVRVTDTVARLGGDEFAILVDDSEHAVRVADRVVAAMQEPVEVSGRSVRTSISVGLAHHRSTVAPAAEDRRDAAPCRTRAVTADDLSASAERDAAAALLMRHADIAMYAAKGAGKSRAVLAETG
ncbi:MAG TPA: GGDEF domain-containing protein [Nocardioidaceae bacterium]|nr:GGDEF domain-containing protein [Nocardioidaceae bacterium]